MAGDEFSELLGRLKERSGLSYGVLGKRLHTSASTLHRYVNGDAYRRTTAGRPTRASRTTPSTTGAADRPTGTYEGTAPATAARATSTSAR
ncbi:hypothetical protein SALBM311S_04137 [Streptomyces alboniger]